MSSNIRNLLCAGSTPLDSLEKKLSDRRQKLQAAIIYGLEAESSLQLIKERLSNLEANTSGRLISANLDTVMQQETENEAFLKQADTLALSLEDVKFKLRSPEKVDEGSSVRTSLRKLSDALQPRLRALQNVLLQWKALINEVKPLAEEFQRKKVELMDWLRRTESEVSLIDESVLTDVTSFKDRLLRLKVSDFRLSFYSLYHLVKHSFIVLFVLLLIDWFIFSFSLFISFIFYDSRVLVSA